MFKRIATRFLITLPAVWLILTMVFLLVHIVPGDPVQQMLGEDARAEDVQQLRHILGLDLPVRTQYAHYLAGLVRGDWGHSFRFGTPVFHLVLERYPATLELAFAAMLVCAAIGIPAGVAAARRRGRATDHTVSVLTLLGLSVPEFCARPNSHFAFLHRNRMAPRFRTRRILTFDSSSGHARRRACRNSHAHGAQLDDRRTRQPITFAPRAPRDSPSAAVLFRHAFPNALVPIITILGLQFGTLLAGTIVTESIFSWPGIGRLTVKQFKPRDYPLLQGCILLIALSICSRESSSPISFTR